MIYLLFLATLSSNASQQVQIKIEQLNDYIPYNASGEYLLKMEGKSPNREFKNTYSYKLDSKNRIQTIRENQSIIAGGKLFLNIETTHSFDYTTNEYFSYSEKRFGEEKFKSWHKTTIAFKDVNGKLLASKKTTLEQNLDKTVTEYSYDKTGESFEKKEYFNKVLQAEEKFDHLTRNYIKKVFSKKEPFETLIDLSADIMSNNLFFSSATSDEQYKMKGTKDTTPIEIAIKKKIECNSRGNKTYCHTANTTTPEINKSTGKIIFEKCYPKSDPSKIHWIEKYSETVVLLTEGNNLIRDFDGECRIVKETLKIIKDTAPDQISTKTYSYGKP